MAPIALARTRSQSRTRGSSAVANSRATRSSASSSVATPSRPTSSRPAKRVQRTVSSENSDDETETEVPQLIAVDKGKQVMSGSSRDSVSSASSVNGNGSDYSTPATSVFATPAPIAQSGKLPSLGYFESKSPESAPRSAVSATDRARLLRQSTFALSPQNQKRKRDAEDEYAEDEIDISEQLARQLQAEEYAAVQATFNSASEEEDEEDDMSRSRRSRQTQPKYTIEDSYDEEEDEEDITPARSRKSVIEDSDESEFTDSDGDEDFEPEKPLQSITMNRSLTITRPSNQLPNIPAIVDASLQSLQESLGAPGPPEESEFSSLTDISETSESEEEEVASRPAAPARRSRNTQRAAERLMTRAARERAKLVRHHPEMDLMWDHLQDLPAIKTTKAVQPATISRKMKPFQLEGLNWMQQMEKTEFGGGLLGDEMGMGKTIQAVSLIMSDYPAKNPSLVLVPPVALMQWQQEIGEYTDGTLKTLVLHGTNQKAKNLTVKDLHNIDVILMSYNSLESMWRHQEKGFKRKDGLSKQKSLIHQIQFHRVILDEAHCIKQRTTGVAKACFALKADHKWCLSGTPLQNRIGEFFSLLRFLDIRPFACYWCKNCKCSEIEWKMDSRGRCTSCNHSAMHHASVFNQELLNPIQKHGNKGPGKEAFAKLRILTDKIMLRRIKRNHSSAMELPAKEIYVDRYFFGEEENDFAGSIMNNSTRKFETYVSQGVMLNNYANIFGLIMQMRQVADHPDLILKKNSEGGQNVIVCCVCDNTAEDPVRSACKHDFCRECVRAYIASEEAQNVDARCPHCHIGLSIDLEQPEIEQDQELIKKTSIINRIKMENWTSSSKIEALLHDLHELRSRNSSSKSIIFSQFTSMLQLVEWRLRRAGITTVMLDGSMTPAQRQASINHFKQNVDVECFLVSLKAGGVALNLTEASKVFIIDPWWNPAAEWQSADRCHRIGQARPCTITRLCIEDSVESRIVLLQEKKANMINSTINHDESAMESLTPEDMEFLFRGS